MEEPVANQRLSRWLALGANAAVLAGIALLVVELDQNREMMRAQIRHELASGIVDLLQTSAGNEQLADILLRAQTGDGLNPSELFRFQVRTNALFRYWENVHYQYRMGLYDDVEFARQRDAWRASLGRSREATRYWCLVQALYSPEFAAEMNGLIASDCTAGGRPVTADALMDFAARYTGAWNSGEPDQVAAFFSEEGVLFVNGSPNTGRRAISELARSFMEGFPDLELVLDALEVEPDRVAYHWTFIGTNTGPGGTGNAVRFSGYEEWTFGEDGLLARSLGHFDETEYRRQLEHGLAAE